MIRSSDSRRRTTGANRALRNAPTPTERSTRPKCQAGAAGLPRTSCPRTRPVDAPAARPAPSIGTPSAPPRNSKARRNVVKPTTALNVPMATEAARMPRFLSSARSPAVVGAGATTTLGSRRANSRVRA